MAFKSGLVGSGETALIAASLRGIALVNMTAMMPSSTIAPPDTGRRMVPTMVAMKIANSRHAAAVMPAGTGSA